MEIEFNKKIDDKYDGVGMNCLFIYNNNLYMKVEGCSDRFSYNALRVGSNDYALFGGADIVSPVTKITVEH